MSALVPEEGSRSPQKARTHQPASTEIQRTPLRRVFFCVSQAWESRDGKGNFHAAGGSAEMPRDVEPRGFFVILAARAAGSVRWERVMPFAAKT